MINFRFHLVSLIAVFLALALGIVVGSTVIDRAIVDGLEAQIDRVERNAEDQRRTNAELVQDFEEVRVFAEQAAPFAIHGRLIEVPVVVLATRGVDEDAVRSVAESMRQAGGVVPAVLWLEPSLALVDADQRSALRDAVGGPRRSADAQRTAAFAALAARVVAGGLPTEAVPVDGAAESEAPADVLAALSEAGFLTVDPAGGPPVDLASYPGAGARVLVLSGPAAQVAAERVFLPALSAFADASLLTLAGEIPDGDDESERAGVVNLVRDEGDLSARVSSVDDAGSVLGRVAVVLALEELGRGEVGHYGLGAGASRRLPEPAGA